MSFRDLLPTVATNGDDALPFLGRVAELAAIESSLDALVGGRGGLDIVSGAPGIGKTRLLHEAVGRAAGRGCRVLRGGAWEGEGAPAFWVWIEVLRSYFPSRIDVVDRRVGSDFRELLREALEGREPGAFVICPDIDTDPHQARFALFDRFCDFLASLTRDGPVAVALDDMHWADPAALLLLQFVAGRLATLPIWILVASRDPLPDAVSISSRHPWARHLQLQGLARAEVQRLLLVGGCDDPPPHLLDRLMSLSEGNPYFAAELGKLLTTGPRDPHDPEDRPPLPPTLVALVHQQLARVSTPCRDLLQVAAVVGRDFDATLVAAARRIPARATIDHLQEAITARIITPLTPNRFRFIHVITREALYDSLPLSTRAHLHERIGNSLESSNRVDPDSLLPALAHHYCMSRATGEPHHALDYALRAAQYCYDSCAYEECTRILTTSLRITASAGPPRSYCESLLLLGAAQAGAGHWLDSRATFAHAAHIARTHSAVDLLARAALGFKGLLSGTLPIDTEAVQLLEEALHGLPPEEHPLRVEILSALSRALYFADDRSAASAYSATALATAHRTGDDRLLAPALEATILSHWMPGKEDLVLSYANRLLDTASRLHDLSHAFQAHLYRIWYLLTVGRAHECDAEVHSATTLLGHITSPRQHWQLLLIRSARAISRGDLTTSHALSSEASALGLRVHDTSAAHHQILQAFQRALISNDLSQWPDIATAAMGRFPSVAAYKAASALIFAKLHYSTRQSPSSHSSSTPHSVTYRPHHFLSLQ